MALQTRKTVLGIKKETTEGTPIAPASATDFIALQSGFSMSPDFDLLQNEELRASIGRAKPVLGLEKPKASLDHYLRHSGTEGTPPNYGIFMESLMGTAVASNGTQRLTTSSSTISLVKLASGGTDFARGKAILLKDTTNGYSIRPILSVSTNDLTPAFNLPGAPATGLGVGKCCHYAPANSDHTSLALWLYRANGGATELMAGSKVASYTMQVNAGQMIKQSFSFEGTGYFYNPITLAAADIKLDFSDSTPTTKAITLTAKSYKDPKDLAEAIQTLMNASGAVDTYTVTYSNTTGKFTFAATGTEFKLKWQSGTNTANTVGDKIGFDTSADDTGAMTYTSDNAQSFAAPYTPTYDSADPLVAKNMEILMGDATDATHYTADEVSVQIGDALANVEDIGAESGVTGKIVTERSVTISLKSRLQQYRVEEFKRYRAGDRLAFAFNFGSKVGGNWTAGKCGNWFMPDAVISKINVGDKNGLVTLELELQPYVDPANTNGEVYLNYL